MYGLKSRSGTKIDMLSVKPQILAYMSFYLIYTSDFWNRKIEKVPKSKKKKIRSEMRPQCSRI